MEGFRGLRLAVHCDLAQGNANMVDLQNLKHQEALGWLVFHRFVWVEKQNHGEFRREDLMTRSPIEARKLWMEQGPAKDVAARLFVGHSFEAPVAATALKEGNREKGERSMEPEATGEPAAVAVHPRKPAQEELFP